MKMLQVLFFVVLSVSPLVVCADSQPVSSNEKVDVSDPIEPVNRGIFWFNDNLDVYVLEPVATGYDKVIPDPVQDSVGNFFTNLRFPSVFVSNVFQGEITDALEQTGRFLVNSTVGLVGLFDVASEIGLKKDEQDFGLMLQRNGVPAGPYLVIPFLGPSNIRDAVGRVVDAGLSPIYYVGSIFDLTDNQAWGISIGAKALDLVDQRANMLDAVKAAKESSVDYYLFMQGAYTQYRNGLVKGAVGAPKIEAADPLADPLS